MGEHWPAEGVPLGLSATSVAPEFGESEPSAQPIRRRADRGYVTLGREDRRTATCEKSAVVNAAQGHVARFGADPNAISQLDKHLTELLATKI